MAYTEPQNISMSILLVGDEAVGKTSFIHRHLVHQFEYKYNPSEGCTTYQVPLYTNKGWMMFNLKDVASMEKNGKFLPGYFKDVDAVIYMFDVSKVGSYYGLKSWREKVEEHLPGKPFIVCGNKYDLQMTGSDFYGVSKKWKCPYFDISVKELYTIFTPLTCLVSTLMRCKVEPRPVSEFLAQLN